MRLAPHRSLDGDVAGLEFLKHDIINLPHYLRQDAEVLVVGVGGGRDLLSALAFDQRRAVGVELNQDILRVLTEVYGSYAGDLAANPARRPSAICDSKSKTPATLPAANTPGGSSLGVNCST